jgi:hypothetical protein
MVRIYFGRPGTKPDQADFKGQKEISWCQNNLGPLTFLSPFGKMPKMSDEESQVPEEFRNYKFVIIEVEEENGEIKPSMFRKDKTKNLGVHIGVHPSLFMCSYWCLKAVFFSITQQQ